MRLKTSNNPFDLTEPKSFGRYYVKRPVSSDWFDGGFNQTEGKQKTAARLNSSLIQRRDFNVWLLVLALGFLLLAARIFYLQFYEGQNLRAVAEGNRIRILDIESSRGLIFDRDHQLLVKNIPSFSLVVIPVDLPQDQAKRQATISALAKKFGQSEAELTQKIFSQPAYSYQPVIVKENLGFEEAVLAKIESNLHPGVALQIDNTRQYLAATTTQSLSHLLGYLGKINEPEWPEYLESGYALNDKVGKAGLEAVYENILKGKKGKEQVEVNAKGETKEILAYQEPQAGLNLLLSIDSDLQKQAEQSLEKILRAYGKKRGAVVALDPRSGEILALVSLPAFDNNAFALGISQADFGNLINDSDKPLFSRAISGEYPPGSTFKLIVGAAALEAGVISANTGFQSVGGIRVDRWFFPDWKAGGHGWTNINKALAESVNTFFYIVGGGYNDFEGLGVARITDYAKKFGLSKNLGIDLPSEAAGFLPSQAWKEEVKKEPWYIGDTYNLSIGQGDVLVTPLQIAFWTSVFANGGILYQPPLVKSVLNYNDEVTTELAPKILNQDFVSPDNIENVKKGLRQAVLSGSARALGNLPINVGAKTGTAQWSSNNANHAWITTLAPYQNPELVVTVLVEEGGEGSAVALPVAFDILNWWAQNRYHN